MSQQTVNLSDIRLTPILESVHRAKISDQEYFSDSYTNYVSNSKLKLINPLENGSPSKFKKGFSHEITTSLFLGSSIHLGVLQPEEFNLGPDIDRPTAKLGLVIDRIYELRKRNKSIYECIIQACSDVKYYQTSLTSSRIKSIIKSGFLYYWKRHLLNDDSLIILSSKEKDLVLNCINSIESNRQAQNILKPKDYFGGPILSYNEDTFFIDIKGNYLDKECIIRLKMKADNWSIDLENKIITLNDLKTTSHRVENFMIKSFNHYHYFRQCSMYIWMLLKYAKQEYDYNKDEWTVKCNIIAVETTPTYKSTVFPINKNILEEGRKEFCRLLKMIAYCEMYDYSDDIIFI